MTTCDYCGKQSCRHRDSAGRDDKIASGSLRSDDQPSGGIGVPRDVSTSAPHSLFEWTDLRELLCVLCSHVVPAGRDQAYLRAHHGQLHVRRGEAAEDRHGLPDGAVRYLVKAKTTTA
jgi:hypothetical protein